MTGAATGTARARVGLLGNPSDGYRGRVIATTIEDFSATVTVTDADRWIITGTDHGPGPMTAAMASSAEGAAALISAALAEAAPVRPDLVAAPARLDLTTTIPRQVGLAGSSAIIIAALRALAVRAGSGWDRANLAMTAWRAETEVLGLAAGPQDRVVQAHDGVLDMDFAVGFNPGGWQRLNADDLPPFLIAWDPGGGDASSIAHSDVRSRFDRGDRDVLEAMTRFASLAEAGRDAIDAGADRAAARWPDLIDEAFALRERFWPLGDFDRAIVDTARVNDAAAALAGSGGALVIVPRASTDVVALTASVEALGGALIEPTVPTSPPRQPG